MGQNENAGASQRSNKPWIISGIILVAVIIVVLIVRVATGGTIQNYHGYEEVKSAFDDFATLFIGEKDGNGNFNTDKDFSEWNFSSYVGLNDTDKLTKYASDNLVAYNNFQTKLKKANLKNQNDLVSADATFYPVLLAIDDYITKGPQALSLLEQYSDDNPENIKTVISSREAEQKKNDTTSALVSATTKYLELSADHIIALGNAKCISNGEINTRCANRVNDNSLNSSPAYDSLARLSYESLKNTIKDTVSSLYRLVKEGQ